MELQKFKLWSIAFAMFIVTIGLIILPNTNLAIGANNDQNSFNVSLVISNTGPSISGVAAASGTPSEGTTSALHVYFNVTDVNGYIDIDPTDSTANVTNGGTTRSSTGCVDYAAWTGGDIRGVDCTILMEYNDIPGAVWDISVTAQDSNPTSANSDDAATMTYGTLWAFTLTEASIGFSSESPGATNVNSTGDPQTLNNTGNGAFTTINLTGYELSNGVDTIGAGNFTVNVTDAKGASVDGTITIADASLARSGTQDLYVWVDIPSGISDGTYQTNSTTQWVVEAYN